MSSSQQSHAHASLLDWYRHPRHLHGQRADGLSAFIKERSWLGAASINYRCSITSVDNPRAPPRRDGCTTTFDKYYQLLQ